MYFTKMLILGFIIYGFTASHLLASPLYPIHNCSHPRFNIDTKGCFKWQHFWDRANKQYWANCSWNPAAMACWEQGMVLYSCPPTQNGLPITLRDLITFHDWSIKVFRDAHSDGEWTKYPRASIAWQHLNGLSIDILGLGYLKRKEIDESIKSLTQKDIALIVSVLLKYSSISDTDAGLSYIIKRAMGCSTDNKTQEKLKQIEKEWKKIRDDINS